MRVLELVQKKGKTRFNAKFKGNKGRVGQIYKINLVVCKKKHTHDSGTEAMRCNLLHELLSLKKISSLKQQVKFKLFPRIVIKNKIIRPMIYTCDFLYKEGKSIVIEDVKGYKTDRYAVTKKILLNLIFTDPKYKGYSFVESYMKKKAWKTVRYEK